MSSLTMLAGGDSLADLVRLPSLEVWLDAIRSPMARDGSNNISQWQDLSGKGNHANQVASDALPVYVMKDGYPAVYSDGVNGRKLDFTHSIGTSDPFTLIALFSGDTGVTDPTTGSSLNVIVSFGGGDASGNSVALRQLRTDAQTISFVAYGSGSTMNGSPFSGFEAYTISYNGTNTFAYYGTTQDPDSGVAAGATRVFGQGRLFNEIPASSSRTGIGWLRGVLLFKESLSSTQRGAIIKAMKARYGLAV